MTLWACVSIRKLHSVHALTGRWTAPYTPARSIAVQHSRHQSPVPLDCHPHYLPSPLMTSTSLVKARHKGLPPTSAPSKRVAA